MTTIINPPIPTGTLHAFAGSTAPAGYLLCDGSAVSRTTYAALFAVLSATYGYGDGFTTFNLPDLRGRLPLGKDNMGGTSAGRVTVGVSSVTSTTLGGVGGHQQTAAHSHTGSTGYMNSNWAHGHYVEGPGGHSHGVWFGGVGGQVTFSFSPAAVNNGAYGSQRDFATTTDTNHTHSFTTDSSGGGNAQNIPPVLVVNYIIKH